jgi:hypothetical protein
VAEPPELWVFVLSNLFVFGLGGVLTGLSYRAFRRTDTRSFALAAAGFALITAGSLVEAVYELGIRGSYELGGRELLALHSVEGLLIGLGLAGLFVSLRRY